MSRAAILIREAADRARAIAWITKAPDGTRLEFKGPRRSLPQNSRLWAMLSDVSEQKLHCGRRYKADVWKVLFMHGTGLEIQLMPSLDNSTMIPWGQSSSDLSKEEMTDLISFIFMWGDANGIVWSDPALRSLLQAAE